MFFILRNQGLKLYVSWLWSP